MRPLELKMSKRRAGAFSANSMKNVKIFSASFDLFFHGDDTFDNADFKISQKKSFNLITAQGDQIYRFKKSK
jgi:hypothetical protein